MQYRTLGRALRAACHPAYYLAALRTLRSFDPAWQLLGLYAGVRQTAFPRRFSVSHNGAQASFQAYSADDVVTAVECFGKLDYRADPAARCIVDFGSNIGLSALYFLLACPGARVYAFEPDPRNVARLRDNLEPFATRYVLDVAAVGPSPGRMQFGREPTGRYGGLGLDFPDHIDVDVRDANAALAAILEREGRIDLLKIDIEGQERPVLEALSAEVLDGIDALVVEIAGTPPVLPGFAAVRHSGIVRYERHERRQSKSNAA